jgi:hypothetical protein
MSQANAGNIAGSFKAARIIQLTHRQSHAERYLHNPKLELHLLYETKQPDEVAQKIRDALQSNMIDGEHATLTSHQPDLMAKGQHRYYITLPSKEGLAEMAHVRDILQKEALIPWLAAERMSKDLLKLSKQSVTWHH